MPCVATTKRTEKRQQAAALQITPNKKSGNRAGKLARSMLAPTKKKRQPRPPLLEAGHSLTWKHYTTSALTDRGGPSL
jgi:hypothetical protein